MPRYILGLFNGHGWLSGAEEQDFADDQAAHEGANYSIRDLVASEVREGIRINLAHVIAVDDAAGRELCRVPFRDAVSFIDQDDAGPRPND